MLSLESTESSEDSINLCEKKKQTPSSYCVCFKPGTVIGFLNLKIHNNFSSNKK